MRLSVINKALGYEPYGGWLLTDDPLGVFMPYCMNRVKGTNRTWFFENREYCALGELGKSGASPKPFDLIFDVDMEIAKELAHRETSIRTESTDGKPATIYLYRSHLCPKNHRREWNDYLRRLAFILKITAKR